MNHVCALGALLVSIAASGCTEDTIPTSPTTGTSGSSGAGNTGGTTGGTSGSGGAAGSTATGGSGGAGGSTGGSGGATGGAGGSTGGSGGATGGAGGSTGGSGGATGGAAGSGGSTGGAAGSGGSTGGAAGSGGATGGSGGATPDAGSDAGKPTAAECDFNGRWLLAQRNLLSLPLGECQAVHTWYYYEMRHDGDKVTVTKGLHCGYEAVKKSAQSANVSNPAMWPAELANMSSTGRTGTFVKETDKCRVTFPVEYVIRGATVAYYQDTSHALPVMGSAAAGPMGNPPGWEDWDNDSNPGFSLLINSPLAKGTLYLATRDSNAVDGTGPLSSTVFKVPMVFTTSQSVLGTAAGSSPLITNGGSPYSDVNSHFMYFMKLQDNQAVGTDTQICEAVRTLKDSLPGDANDMPVSATCK